MTRYLRQITPAVFGAALILSPVPVLAKPNILPGDAAQHLPKLNPEIVERRKAQKELRQKQRDERRLKRQQQRAKQ